jgi:hypothetical protein
MNADGADERRYKNQELRTMNSKVKSDVLGWLEYKWNFDFPAGMYRAVLGRLRGTPGRLEELLRGASREALTRKPGGKWSVLEHVGHLLILDERLHAPRVEQYLRGEAELLAADMSNRATGEARFNEREAGELLREFRAAREQMLRRLDALTLADAERVARHPRLNVPMRLVDLCYFCAEHDDHHVAMIHEMVGGGR